MNITPNGATTPTVEPACAAEPEPNSIEVIVNGLSMGHAIEITAYSVSTQYETGWSEDTKAVRLGRATLTFHGN